MRSLLLSLVAISGPVTIDQIGTTKRTATSNTLEIYYQIKTYAQRQLSSGDQQSSSAKRKEKHVAEIQFRNVFFFELGSKY